MDYGKESLKLHKELKVKIGTYSKKKIDSIEYLSLIYTPGVAASSKEIPNEEQNAS